MKTFEEIEAGVYLISAGRANSYLLAGDDLALVDTGLPGEEDSVIAGIGKIGRKPDELNHILITHAHMDHMGSLAALKKVSGAQVVASSKEVEKTWTMGREGLGGKIFKGVLYLLETFSFNYEPVSVDMPCQGGEVIDCFGGMQVIATPGHSPGSLSYYQRERKMLFTGDALSGAPQLQLPPRLGCADYRAALTSVGKLAELGVAICLFGHGRPLTAGASEGMKKLLPGVGIAPA
jgi:glyoxylase-like metal-dependent hydrolase (beta-lactamase superfamily II)